MVQFDCPRHWNPCVSSSFGVGRTPFSHYWPSLFLHHTTSYLGVASRSHSPLLSYLTLHKFPFFVCFQSCLESKPTSHTSLKSADITNNNILIWKLPQHWSISYMSIRGSPISNTAMRLHSHTESLHSSRTDLRSYEEPVGWAGRESGCCCRWR